MFRPRTQLSIFPAPAGGTGDGLRRLFFRRSSQADGASAAADAPPPSRRTAKLARLEAALLVADGPVSTRRLAQLATLADAGEAGDLIESLNAVYDAEGTAFRVERVANGFRLLTRPEYAPWLDKLHPRQTEWKLSPPAMETLTIIAYRQPVTRADVESVRGVQSAEIIKHLMDRDLVRIAGEEDSLGRPYLYETTSKFLETYGLRTLDELPMAERLRRVPAGNGSGPAEAPALAPPLGKGG